MTPRIFPFFILIVSVLTFSACSIEGMGNKILPEEIKQESVDILDAIMDRDAQFFIERKMDLLPPDILNSISNEEFAESIKSTFSAKPAEEEISRHMVGASKQVTASLGDTPVSVYEAVYEIETSEGFVLVSLRLANRVKTNDCCELKFIDVRDYETSPIYAQQMKVKKAVSIVGFLALGLLTAFGFLLVGRRRIKKKTS